MQVQKSMASHYGVITCEEDFTVRNEAVDGASEAMKEMSVA